jgi:hypothetical protein
MCHEPVEESCAPLPEPTPPPQPPADHPLAGFYRPGSPSRCRGDTCNGKLPAIAASYL